MLGGDGRSAAVRIGNREGIMGEAEQPRGDTAPLTGEPGETRLIVEDLQRDIAVAAYYRALARGFSGGDAFDDWLAAEREILAKRRRLV
jgi:hypothetical protein